MSKDLVILGINRSHNASSCLLVNGEVVYNIESERISNIKYDHRPFMSIFESTKYVNHIDYIVNVGMKETEKNNFANKKDFYLDFISGIKKKYFVNNNNYFDFWDKHHLCHAANSFYSSGFDEAICIVKDGMGSEFYIDDEIFYYENKFSKGYGREIYSIYHVSYPNNFKILKKIITIPSNSIKKEYLEKKLLAKHHNYEYEIILTDSVSEAFAFELTSKKFNFHQLDSGKVMGMSSYGKTNLNDDLFYKKYYMDKNIFFYNPSLLDGTINYKNIQTFDEKCNFSSILQKTIEDKVIKEILKTIKKYNSKKICLSGGLFLNCVMNYKLLDFLPNEVNLYIDPISNDSGTSIGAAKYLHYELTKENIKYNKKNIYFGPKREINIDIFKNFNVEENISEKEIAYLILKRNTIGIFQEKSENGPRALGNRSILYDSRDPNGKDIVNKIKNREWFRPFAGSVLFENCKEWFDMKSLEESPYMLFAVNVLKEKQKLIPAITHVDGTCRIQTVKYEDNKIFYNIIKEFYDLSGIPIILNTSFNLAGDAIVEFPEDALNVLKKSNLDYIYFSEKNILVSKK